MAEQLPRYFRLQRGATPAFRANSLDLFRQFADAKYKTFDLEKTRERDKEVLRQITKLAEDTRVNDQQRKELYAVQKQIEEKEKELAGRQAEMDKRKQEMDAPEAQKAQAEEHVATASRHSCAATQNYQSAASSSSDGCSDLNNAVSTVQNIKGLFGF